MDGIIKAGLIGEIHGNWLEIDYLWVEKGLRKTGIGSQLLQEAESEAKRRGCKYCFLNTFGFQAPNFYMKYGYKEVFYSGKLSVGRDTALLCEKSGVKCNKWMRVDSCKGVYL